ncbi:MAG: Patatin [Candidatus Gallionella acididurans]|uniref:Patatin n=1 Tax=Candidatus Gallionella acididurans TaxID=1796491 RepID=A0A139BXV8_9PROT|nr:MAG: Patatin [Candidatus Gallionella acididurans]
MQNRLGLILTGGGARAAYQVGVLKAIADSMPRGARSPFPIICGTSAGALNAAALAANAQNFRKATQYLANTWRGFHANRVYRTDFIGVFSNSMLWLAGMVFSAFNINKLNRVSLLDNSPLVELLEDMVPYENIQKNIDAGFLHALSITASGYGSGQSVTFYQGVKQLVPWRRTGRVGTPTQIEIKHLLASAALPFIFQAKLINREYFGDGSMRQIAPLSPALHLGATRVLVIGVTLNGYAEYPDRGTIGDYPTLARIAGHALNSIFLDSMEVDLERVKKINDLVAIMPEEMRARANLRHVDVLVVSPSQPLEKIAERYASEMPWTIRLLLRLVGARQSGGILLSYLLSESKYTRALIDLGYQDTLNRRDEILRFLEQPGAEMPE